MQPLQICIPSYNYGHYLSEAIDSCLSQDIDFRLVVLDNASTDNTPELRHRYKHDQRVAWYRNETLLPIQENWNKAVSLTNDGWVKLLQADDRLIQGSIDALSNFILDNPSYSFIGHLSEIIDSCGHVIRRHSPYSMKRQIISLDVGEGPGLKLQHVARLREPSSNLFKKSAWKAVGGYSSKLRYTFDIAFNIELMTYFSGALYSSYFAQIRRHSRSDGALLPPDLALSDLKIVVRRMAEVDGSKLSEKLAASWIQYRTLELLFQRFKSDPFGSAAFILRNLQYVANARSFPATASTIVRRIKTGDVQRILE